MSESKSLFNQLKDLSTEQRNPVSMDIDARSTIEILSIINNEDKKIAGAVEKEIPYIARAVEAVTEVLGNQGRLIYVGAGTSGRLGVLDAAECPPTFGTDPKTIIGLIAGGDAAMFRSQEGAEDKETNGAADMKKKRVGKKDIVCGIAASLRTPYVVGAVKKAKWLGAKTIYITTNPRAKFDLPEFADLKSAVDIAICPEAGPEVIMGSTRMKSGTAQKLVLNMITTAAMIRLGKIYENMMIDLQMTNKKLRERAKRIIMTIAGVEYEEAAQLLEQSGDHVKTALVMAKAGVTKEKAKELLLKANGFIRNAIESEE